MIPDDSSLVAARLVEQLGPRAVDESRMHFVELTAAEHHLAADFWRQVMIASQRLLAQRQPPDGAA